MALKAANNPTHIHRTLVEEEYAWGMDGQDDEEREPEAFIVDRSAADKAEHWVDEHYLMPPCDPDIERTRNVEDDVDLGDSAELANRLVSLEIENCEMAGRMMALEGLLREKEEEMEHMRRQLTAYAQALETLGRGSEGLSTTQLITQVMTLSKKVQELEDENSAMVEAAGGAAKALNLGKKPSPATAATTHEASSTSSSSSEGAQRTERKAPATALAGSAVCQHCGLRLRQAQQQAALQQQVQEALMEALVPDSSAGQLTVTRSLKLHRGGEAGGRGGQGHRAGGGRSAAQSDSQSGKQWGRRQYREEDDVDSPERMQAGIDARVLKPGAGDKLVSDEEGTEQHSRSHKEARAQETAPDMIQPEDGAFGNPSSRVTLPYPASCSVQDALSGPMQPADSLHASASSPALPRSSTAGLPQLMTSPVPSCQPRGPLTSPMGQAPGSREIEGVNPLSLEALPPAAMKESEYAPPRTFHASASMAVTAFPLGAMQQPLQVAAGKQGGLLQALWQSPKERVLPGPPLAPPPRSLGTGAHRHGYGQQGRAGPSVTQSQSMPAVAAAAAMHLAAAYAGGGADRSSAAQGGHGAGQFQRLRERVMEHQGQLGTGLSSGGNSNGGGGNGGGNSGGGGGVGADDGTGHHAAEKKAMHEGPAMTAGIQQPILKASPLEFHSSTSSQQGLGAVRGALITALRVRPDKREEVLRQLDGLLRTQRVSSEDIAAGLKERCLPLLTMVTPPPRPVFSMFHRSRVTDAQQAFLCSPSVSHPAQLLAAAIAFSWCPCDLVQDLVQMLPTIAVRRLVTLEFFCAVFARMGKISVDMILADLPNLDECLGVEEEGLPSVMEFSGCKVLVLVRGKDGLQCKHRWVFGGK